MPVFKSLRESRRLPETFFMLALSILCFSIFLVRCSYTKNIGYIFLNKNLVLACIPWLLTSISIVKNLLQKSKAAAFVMLLLWLLFFPNAPYVLTDLLYLQKLSMPTIPVWYDLLMIMSFAWTSLLFGFLSLWDIERILLQKINIVIVRVISTLLLFLGSFGVYLGRFLRWNSWDIIVKPDSLVSDVLDRFANPFEHQSTWGMTIFLCAFLNVVYWSFVLFQSKVKREEKIPVQPKTDKADGEAAEKPKPRAKHKSP